MFNNTADKPVELFKAIRKNIRFEADENKQNDKEAENKLDSDLDALKAKKQGDSDGKSNQSNTSDNAAATADSESSANGDTEGSVEDSGDSQSETAGGDSTATGAGSSGDAGDDVGGEDVDGRETDKFGHSAIRERTRPVDRKLGLYTEFNKLDTSVRQALTALNASASTNKGIKDVISQLNSIQDNLTHILGQFTTFTEKELLLHYDMLKERVKVATLCISRIDKKQKSEKQEIL